jgi:hypothetical protein
MFRLYQAKYNLTSMREKEERIVASQKRSIAKEEC